MAAVKERKRAIYRKSDEAFYKIFPDFSAIRFEKKGLFNSPSIVHISSISNQLQLLETLHKTPKKEAKKTFKEVLKELKI